MTYRLLDFMMIGPTCCGTSSFYENLLQHPRIDGPRKDKNCYFYAHHKREIEWYKAQFPNVNPDILLCDATSVYIFYPECPERIYRWLPDIKLIVMLRNPIARSWSHFYRHRNRRNFRQQDLMRSDYSILKQGVYADLLLPWFEYFDREQFLIIKSEDFFKDEGLILNECFKFLHLPDKKFESYEYFNPRNKRQDRTKNEPLKIPRKIEEWLRQYFAPHNQRLYKLLERDFKWA